SSLECTFLDRIARWNWASAGGVRQVEFSRLAWQRRPGPLFPHSKRCRNYTGSAILCLVLLCHGSTLLDPSLARRRHRTLSCRAHQLFWLRSSAHSSIQHRSHLACSAVALVGLHIFSCCRNFPGSDDCRQGTETPALALLWAPICARFRSFWKFGGRIR